LSASQDTLTTMAEDSRRPRVLRFQFLRRVFDRVVNDTSRTYVLGYSSSNPARDGRFRRIKVRLKRTDLKLEYRSGYYAPRDFAHSTKDDREQQLQDQLLSDLFVTDLSAYVSTAYFRLADNRYSSAVGHRAWLSDSDRKTTRRTKQRSTCLAWCATISAARWEDPRYGESSRPTRPTT